MSLGERGRERRKERKDLSSSGFKIEGVWMYRRDAEKEKGEERLKYSSGLKIEGVWMDGGEREREKGTIRASNRMVWWAWERRRKKRRKERK